MELSSQNEVSRPHSHCPSLATQDSDFPSDQQDSVNRPPGGDGQPHRPDLPVCRTGGVCVTAITSCCVAVALGRWALTRTSLLGGCGQCTPAVPTHPHFTSHLALPRHLGILAAVHPPRTLACASPVSLRTLRKSHPKMTQRLCKQTRTSGPGPIGPGWSPSWGQTMVLWDLKCFLPMLTPDDIWDILILRNYFLLIRSSRFTECSEVALATLHDEDPSA